jgi:alkylation response protein AidB-like acyl-CoA dehydrogenase
MLRVPAINAFLPPTSSRTPEPAAPLRLTAHVRPLDWVQLAAIAEPFMTYRAPVADILFALKHAAGFGPALAAGLYGDLGEDVVDAVLAEAGRFATDVLAPLDRIGDRAGTPFRDGAVTTPPGWRAAYRDWAAAGWNGLAAPAQWGGQELPQAVSAACTEMWNSASMAFSIGPLLTMAGVDALLHHGSETLKRLYLPKLVSGEWMGTMQLTEPQAGSDVGALRTKAERAPDGTYRISGSKIFITYGEHDFTDNIVHLVLARLPDAPAGTRGLSLFLIPKFAVKADGSLGPRNDVRAHSVEHKLGIHGSPTCTMVYGDQGGATGFLVGEENRGMACMFTMMNQARLGVGLQGVGIAERATQTALAYAQERRQGRAAGASGATASPIIEHPDVKRMLMTMRSLTRAARAVCYATAVALDRAERSPDTAARQAAHERASLLTPVAKAFSTDVGSEVASLGVQVHGGMGYIEETGAAQLFRDARIAQIYEGTNGIQAIDLVTRKLPLSGGAPVRACISEFKRTVEAIDAVNDPAFGWTGARLGEAVESLDRATQWLLACPSQEAALAGATPYLRLFAVAAGGAGLAEGALAAMRLDGASNAAGRIAIARFFAENVAVAATGLERTVVEGAEGVTGADAALAS